MQVRPLGRTGLEVTPIGFGAFKLGRNQNTKYGVAYDLPDEETAARVLNGVLDLGVRLIDVAPAYGLAEERIGRSVAHRRDEFVLSTKVGEIFEDGVSRYDFSRAAVLASVEQSLKRLRTAAVDLLLVHANHEDVLIQQQSDIVPVLQELRERGWTRAIGLSGKTVEGARLALEWADVLMVEYHPADETHRDVIAEAGRRGLGVLVKKGLGSGRLPAAEAVRFVLSTPDVDSLVIGGLDLEHLRMNIASATSVAGRS